MRSETELHQAQTGRFISANPTDLVLRRKVQQADNAGGISLGTESDIYSQRVRVVGQRNPLPTITPDGRSIVVQKVVVGMGDLDIAEGDTFTYDSLVFRIEYVQRDPSMWRVEAGASRIGI